MRAGLGLGIAALAAVLSAWPSAAQNVAEPPPRPPAGEVIGPDQLRDFTLNGTVTRQADPQPTARPAPRRQPAETSAPPNPQPRPADPARQVSSQPATPREAPAIVDLPPADSPLGPPTAVPSVVAPAFSGAPVDAPVPAGAAPLPESPSLLPWLLAALAAALGAGWLFWRQRLREAHATFDLGAGVAPKPPVPEPAPRPAPPPAPKPAGPGIVSARLRPSLEIEFAPTRCVYADDGATIEFEAALLNSGAAPARDVLLEVRLFNAGEAQDRDIEAFFAHPVGQGQRLRQIPPLQRITLKHAVSLPREQLRAYQLEERLLWVPTVGFNAVYRWAGGEGQTSASFLIGRETKGEKMAPFRLDRGPRIFRGLGARLHTVGVRK